MWEIFSSRSVGVPGRHPDPIRFGFLGNTLKVKDFPLFVEVANAMTAKYGCYAEFHVLGGFGLDRKPVNGTKALVTKSVPAGMRTLRDDFIRGVSALHFVVLPNEAAPHALAANGVLLDAIVWQKPVIAKKIPMFEALFEKYGDIGYLFSDDSEVTGIVEQILETADTARYRRQVLKLREVRKSRDPETLAAAYRELCRTSEGK